MMLRSLMIMLTLLASCATVAQPAICAATANDRDALTAALIADGGPLSLVAGQHLIAKVDYGCGGY